MLRWFEKDPSDAFAGELELEGISLPVLQAMFHVDEDNPMYDCWSVEAEHVDMIQKHSRIRLELDKFDYFLEADASDD